MTPIRISLALAAILLFQVEMAAAARITLAFDGHFVGLNTDGGVPLPAGIDITIPFSGIFTYDLGLAENLPVTLTRGTASANTLFYSPGNHDLVVNLGGYRIQSQTHFALFLDNVLHIETQIPADVIALPFSNNSYGNYPLDSEHHQLSLQFADLTTLAMDNISLTEPLGADWRIPLELFGDISLHISVYEEFLEDPNSSWPPYRNYYMLEGQIDSIREVPLPAAGAMFALALVQLIAFRRRLR